MDAAREWVALDAAAALVVLHPRAVASHSTVLERAMAILRNCSVSGILYQRDVHFTRRGYAALLRHLV